MGNLQAQITSNQSTDNGQIELLWSENENTAKQLETERAKTKLLETQYKTMEFKYNREMQKRQLLESQTRRLTAELTKYLDAEMDDAKESVIDEQTSQMPMHYRKASMNAKAGWLKFLSSTNRKSNSNNKQSTMKKKMMRQSINNIKEKMAQKVKKKSKKQSDDETIEQPKH